MLNAQHLRTFHRDMASNEAQVVSQFPLPPRQFIEPFAEQDAAPPMPPEPPHPDSSYAMFGRVYSTADRLPTLAEAGRVCLYDDALPPTQELLRLNSRLLALFYSLLATLATAAAPHAPVVARIEDVLINMHHLLNTLRPAQAAVDLASILREQEKTRKATTVQLAEASKLAEEEIAAAAKRLGQGTGEPDDENAALAEAMNIVSVHLNRGKSSGGGSSMDAAIAEPSPRKWYASLPASDSKVDVTTAAEGYPGFSADVLEHIERITNDPDL